MALGRYGFDWIYSRQKVKRVLSAPVQSRKREQIGPLRMEENKKNETISCEIEKSVKNGDSESNDTRDTVNTLTHTHSVEHDI